MKWHEKNRNNLYLHDIQDLSNSYDGVDDVYSHYFQPSPQPHGDSFFKPASNSNNSQTPLLEHETLKLIVPTPQPQEPKPTTSQSQNRPNYAEYRDSPIIARSSHSISSLNIPKSPQRYFWDPIVAEWRTLDFENIWDLDNGQEIEISDKETSVPRGNVSKHSRHASEPSLPANLPTPKTRFVFSELLRDSKDIHPTLEFALRYSEPSPLVSTFKTTIASVPNEDSQLHRRILVEVLGATNLTQLDDPTLSRTGCFSCISIADNEFMTPVVKGSRPEWNSQFLFESARDTDPFEIYVWNDMGPYAKASLQGSFVATVRRILLMQTLNEVLTLTLDRWPGEMEIMGSSQCGSVVIRVRDITEYAWNESIMPFTPSQDFPYPSLYSSPRAPPWNINGEESETHEIISQEIAKETNLVEQPKWFTDIIGRTLSLKKGRYPWIPTGDITIISGPVCGGRYCDIYVGDLKRPKGSVRVALKQLRVFINASDMRFWNKLRHPNVLPFWGCWELDEYRLFMISPWARNGNSLDYVKKNPTVDRCQILRQTAEALVYLHAGIDGLAIVHGDLKADNVLISGNGVAMLADFGLARYVQKLTEVSGTPSGLSPHGHVRFSAPELLLPKPGTEPRPTPESDVFAFGCFMIQVSFHRKSDQQDRNFDRRISSTRKRYHTEKSNQIHICSWKLSKAASLLDLRMYQQNGDLMITCG
ncbi:hypothetical protein Clacol_006241 [Clathrus columnatus]|uniref:Protein kinase domain-containing protein n=1 Tax=Clathrus columnatus TaxID=1419009 RepID=A0AAV5AEQ6_9AGAM|nr:hypothetical protein Clacol_006241 [Clathrus columnatus]